MGSEAVNNQLTGAEGCLHSKLLSVSSSKRLIASSNGLLLFSMVRLLVQR
jgi:hypothetical protein